MEHRVSWRVSGLDDEDIDEEQVELRLTHCAATWDRCEVKILRGKGLKSLLSEKTSSLCCCLYVDGEELGKTREESAEEDVCFWSGSKGFQINFQQETNIGISIEESPCTDNTKKLLSISFKPYQVRESRRSSGAWNPNIWYQIDGDAGIAIQCIFVDEVPEADCDRCIQDVSIMQELIQKKYRSAKKPKSMRILSVAERRISIFQQAQALIPQEHDHHQQQQNAIVSPTNATPFFGLEQLGRFVSWGKEHQNRLADEKLYAAIIATAKMPVFLHVYDLGTSTFIGGLNRTIQGPLSAGIFHTGVEVGGHEFSFGGCRTKNKTGIFTCRPRRCPLHTYRESIYLGDSGLSEYHIQAIVDALKPRFLGTQYDLLRLNCCTFSRELCIDLGVGDIPAWTDRLATVGASLAGPVIVSPSSSPPTTESQIISDNHDDLADYELAAGQVQDSRDTFNVDRILLEHVMAYKMQTILRQHTMQHHARCHSNRLSMIDQDEDPRLLFA